MTDAGSPTPPSDPAPSWVAPSTQPPLPPLESGIRPGWSAAGTANPIDDGVPRPAEVYGYQPPPTYANPLAAHKPGIVPLRPLGLGDILAGSFTAITTNLRAVAAISAVIAVLSAAVTLIVAAVAEAVDLTADDALGTIGGLTTVTIATSAALTALLTGALAYPTSRAVEGRYPSLRRCWERLRPRLPAALAIAAIEFAVVGLPLILLTAIFAAAGITLSPAFAVLGAVGVLVVAAALLVVGTYVSFALPIAVLEGLAPMASLRRSVMLVGPLFWRVLGTLLLIGLIVGVAQSVLTSPVDLIGSVAEDVVGATAATTVKLALSTILYAVAEFVTLPLVGTAITLLYTDARIRLEGFDIALISAVENTPREPA